MLNYYSAGYQQPIYRVVQKTDTQFYFWDNFGNSAPILSILSLLQLTSRNLWRVNVKFHHPPHLYCVTTLPSKTNTTANITAKCFVLLTKLISQQH